MDEHTHAQLIYDGIVAMQYHPKADMINAKPEAQVNMMLKAATAAMAAARIWSEKWQSQQQKQAQPAPTSSPAYQ